MTNSEETEELDRGPGCGVAGHGSGCMCDVHMPGDDRPADDPCPVDLEELDAEISRALMKRRWTRRTVRR